MIGGIATSHYGLHKTALVYSIAVAALAAAAAGLTQQMSATRRASQPTIPKRPRHRAPVRAPALHPGASAGTGG